MLRLRVIALCAAALVACSSEGDSGADPTTVAANAVSAADDALLTLDDFPDGWTAKDSEISIAAQPPMLDVDCEALRQQRLVRGLAAANSRTFVGPSFEEVSSGVAIYADEATARSAFNLHVAVLTECREQMEAAWRKAVMESALAQGGSPTGRVEATIEEREFRALGGRSAAHRFALDDPVTGYGITTNTIVVHERRIVGVMTYLTFGAATAEYEEDLAGILETRLREADRMLDRAP